MPKTRLEAFTDGVIAFVITLLVLDIHVPVLHGAPLLHSLPEIAPKAIAYAVGFMTCAVWWIAHHHFLHQLERVDKMLLWLNTAFLFWLVTMPFTTALLGEYPLDPTAGVIYGVTNAMTGLCFLGMRVHAIRWKELLGPEYASEVQRKNAFRSALSPTCYTIGALLSLVWTPLALVIYAVVPVYFMIATKQRQSN